jgi:glycosyltransferase involved in cell wall biosynthesis
MIDLFITTHGRQEMFRKSLASLLESSDRNQYRLTIVVDGGLVQGTEKSCFDVADHVLWHKDSQGLGPSINQALIHISNLNTYFDNNKSNFICMCQDDVEYEKGWLDKLVKVYGLFSRTHKIGFVSGHNAPEHATTGQIKFGKDTLLLKPWIRATNMFTTAEYFLSMYPIPRMDPETGRERARPHGGMGSSVDWWFIRNHTNSVCKSGRINIVWPGLIKHIGDKSSTWLGRDLPEDK